MTNANQSEDFKSSTEQVDIASKINAQANGTTTSGDDKGAIETITSKDVGDLSAVLGNLANAAVTGNTTAELVSGDAAKDPAPATGSITEIAAAAAEVAKSASGTAAVEVKATGGTVTTAAEVVKAPVVTAAAEVKAEVVEKKTIQAGTVVKSTAAVPTSQLPEVVAALQVAKPHVISSINNILEYARAMHPAQPQNTASIEKNQVSFLVSLKGILINEDENFATVFKAVVAIFKAHRTGAFAVTMRNRGLNSISLTTIDNVDMRFLTRLVDALYVASGMNDISKVKTQVDMEKLLSAVVNVKAKNNLTAFFS